MIYRICTFLFFLTVTASTFAQSPGAFNVIAYYAGGPEKVDSLPVDKLTHIIFSFCHLTGNKLTVDDQRDSATISKLAALKRKYPRLKVILSLGGWGGCPTCSDVFATDGGRKEFTRSVVALNQYFNTDGLDLDWEYPAIEGYPGHKYVNDDKKNFTALVRELRKGFGKKYELSFAAGGFKKFLELSVDWKEVMPLVDRVNLMSYDLINGYATQTGHHTALYSRKEQMESTDHAVQYLIRNGVPRNKIVIGAAFYGRIWENVPAVENGLYQPGKFKMSVHYKNFATELSEQKGYAYFWDDAVKAPYLYNAAEKLFVTYDDKRSIELKSKYVVEQQLDGIMFWELTHDPYQDGLLDVIDQVKHGRKDQD